MPDNELHYSATEISNEIRKNAMKTEKLNELKKEYNNLTTQNLLLFLSLPKFMKKDKINDQTAKAFVKTVAELVVRIKTKFTPEETVESYQEEIQALRILNEDLGSLMQNRILELFDIPEISQQSLENLDPSIALSLLQSFIGGSSNVHTTK